MSIWASWQEVGEDGDGEYTREALSYSNSATYPTDETRPALIGVSHLPGFVWRPHLPESRRDQTGDTPVAPFLRLDIASWHPEWGRPMIADGSTAILTRSGVERLRDQLTEWLALDHHEDPS